MKTKRAKRGAKPYPESWELLTQFTPEGHRELSTGRTFKLAGERGRFKFVRAVHNTSTGQYWIDCLQVTASGDIRGGMRSFDPSRVTRVHNQR